MSRGDQSWVDRFEQASWPARLGLVGGSAVRAVAGAIDRALDRAATVAVEAEDAFRKELDPNVENAVILEEHDGGGGGDRDV